MFCAGGIDKENPLNPKDNRENGVMVFFRDRIGPILNNGWTKFLVMLLFIVYLGVSSWGVSQLREGLERRKLSRYDSYTVAYYDTEDLYFREYPYRVNVSFELICMIKDTYFHEFINPLLQNTILLTIHIKSTILEYGLSIPGRTKNNLQDVCKYATCLSCYRFICIRLI